MSFKSYVDFFDVLVVLKSGSRHNNLFSCFTLPHLNDMVQVQAGQPSGIVMSRISALSFGQFSRFATSVEYAPFGPKGYFIVQNDLDFSLLWDINYCLQQRNLSLRARLCQRLTSVGFHMALLSEYLSLLHCDMYSVLRSYVSLRQWLVDRWIDAWRLHLLP